MLSYSRPAVVLSGPDESLFNQLWQTWVKKRRRNLIRSVYYDTHNALKDFGISIPPRLRNVNVALGWIGKGVHALTDRSVLEGFVTPDSDDDPYGIDELMIANDFAIEFPQATVSSAVHACSFLTISSGDVAAGEAPVLVRPRAADMSAGLWDSRRRSVKGFLAIADADAYGPSVVDMWTPEWVFTFSKTGGGWTRDARRNILGEVPVAVLPLKPELGRPFGHSRITRAGMYYVDAALRTILRSEVSSEFYSSVEYWLFGANVRSFIGDDKWSAVMGRVKALDVEEGDEMPDLHRFNGATPGPHIEQLRMWATLFAGEFGLSLSQLGIVQDNPNSAEAMYAAKEDLITDARSANRTWGRGAVKAMQLAIRLRDRLDVVPTQLTRLSAQFTDPAIVSPTAAADAFTKRAAVIPGFAESEVGLESAGLTREQILRFQAEQRRKGVGSVLESLRNPTPDPALDEAAAATGAA